MSVDGEEERASVAIATEVLYGRPTSGRVFISSQMRDAKGRKVYESERLQLADAVGAIPFLHPWIWERDAPVGEYSSERVCVAIAETSDCLVLAVGRELTPITRQEWEAAGRAQAHRFVFQDTRVQPSEEIREFITSARAAGAITGYFASAEDLAEKAVAALLGQALHSMRRSILARRLPPALPSPVEDRNSPWNAPPERKYEQIDIAFGDEEEGFKTVKQMIDEARERANSGQVEGAFEDLHGLAWELHANGRPDIAHEVIADLRGIVPLGRLSPPAEAWLSNTEALVLARLGRQGEAKGIWERMRATGDRLDDDGLKATALQNLATVAVDKNDLDEAESLAREAMDLKLALEDYRAVLQIVNTLVLIDTARGDFDQAERHLEFYERMARELGDIHLLDSAYGNRGGYLVAQGEFEAAEEQYRKSLAVSRKIGDPVRELLSLQNMGAVNADKGDLGAAMRWYRKGVRLADTYELEVHAEVLHRSLAGVLHRAGRNREALEEFDRARRAAFASGAKDLWAQSTVNIGGVYSLLGEPAAALDPLEQAAIAFREIGDFDWEFRARRNLAIARSEVGDVATAVDEAERSCDVLGPEAHEERAAVLRLAAEMCLTDPGSVKRSTGLFEKALDEEEAYLSGLEAAKRAAITGAFLSGAGECAAAVRFFDRAIEVFAEQDDQRGLFDTFNDRAIAFGGLHEFDRARDDLGRCRALADALGDSVLRQRAVANLGEIERRDGRDVIAVSLLSEALVMAREIGDPEVLRDALSNYSLALEDRGQIDESEKVLQELETLGKREGMVQWEADAARGAGRLAFLRKDFREAAKQYQRARRLQRSIGLQDIFALGGFIESQSRDRRNTDLSAAVQELVDWVKDGGDSELAISYIGRSGVAWAQHGDLEESTSLFGIALLVGALELGSEEDSNAEVDADELRRFGEAVGFLIMGANKATAPDDGEFYALVFDYLDKNHGTAGTELRAAFETVREVMEPILLKNEQ